MMWPKRAALAIGMVVAVAAIARADRWNDRTTLKFDAPMMIPGATLAPGTYTFKLLDSTSNRHVVQIFNEDGTRLVATTQAVPAKRMDPKGDVVVKLNPTEAGAPVALKAWFYPGSLYGHEFVYPDKQARDIARRTKTLVLSTDVAGSDMEKGTLYTYTAEGLKQPWHPDDAVMKEWAQSREHASRRASAGVAAPTPKEATAPMVHAEPVGMKVSIDDFEEHPQEYVGKTVSVTAQVEEVFGPRLFKIDEPSWADLDGEVLVYLPSNLAALVREDDRVTVTGTPKMFVKADIERELGWLEPDPDVEIEFDERPVLVASRIVGGNSDVAVAIALNEPVQRDSSAPDAQAANRPVGTSGTADAAAPLTDLGALGNGDEELVGRRVELNGVEVAKRGGKQGFWIEGRGASLFVLPSTDSGAAGSVTPGQAVSIEGIVLAMPRSMREKAAAVDHGNDEIYLYATSVK
jgi:hypothetical protein